MAKVKVDLSVIAATNRRLEDAIAAGKFREDLYYRLKVVTLVVPPLRERKEDIPELIHAFIADFNRRNDGKIRGIAPHALKRLMEYDWPGNVRELKNAVESAAVLASGETIDSGAFADALRRAMRSGTLRECLSFDVGSCGASRRKSCNTRWLRGRLGWPGPARWTWWRSEAAPG